MGCCVIGNDSPTKEGRQQWNETFQHLKILRRNSIISQNSDIENGTTRASDTGSAHAIADGNIITSILLSPKNVLSRAASMNLTKNNGISKTNLIHRKKDKIALTNSCCNCQYGTNDVEVYYLKIIVGYKITGFI